MKTKMQKTFIFFISILLPLNWITGFAIAMLYNNKKTETNFLLYGSVLLSVATLTGVMVDYMKYEQIKAWYSVACEIASLGILILSAWIYIT